MSEIFIHGTLLFVKSKKKKISIKNTKAKSLLYTILFLLTSYIWFPELLDYSDFFKKKVFDTPVSCRIGMTQDLERREKKWVNDYKKEGKTVISWKMIGTYESKSDAQEAETREAKIHNCFSYPGGQGAENATWYLYKLEWRLNKS